MSVKTKYPPAPEEIKFNNTVLVIGGGAAGILAAEKAVQTGMSVVLLEKTAELGGVAAKFSSIYQSDLTPSQWLKDKAKAFKKNKNVTVYKNAELEKVEGQAGNFTATIKLSEKKEEIVVGTIIVATGMELSTTMPVSVDVGAERFISQVDFEKKVSEFEASETKTFVFVIKEDDFLCGTANALNNALKLKTANHNVYVIYDEMKVSEANMEKMYHQARQQGVYFVRGTSNYNIGQKDGGLTLTIADSQLPVKLAKELVINFDYLIFNEELLPGKDTRELAAILRVNTAPNGFFQEDNYHLEPVYSNRAGIYFVGACRMPELLHNIKEQADAAVNSIFKLGKADVKTLMDQKPLIDVVKCVYCLTCYRSCPRNAIELMYDIEGAAWNGAPYVHPYACQNCGCCVAECPNRAISFPGYTDEDMQKQFQKIGGKA